jgi:hypothetical protein
MSARHPPDERADRNSVYLHTSMLSARGLSNFWGCFGIGW